MNNKNLNYNTIQMNTKTASKGKVFAISNISTPQDSKYNQTA
jgi:hypothetical protein